jgi:hypothetical protein
MLQKLQQGKLSKQPEWLADEQTLIGASSLGIGARHISDGLTGSWLLSGLGSWPRQRPKAAARAALEVGDLRYFVYSILQVILPVCSSVLTSSYYCAEFSNIYVVLFTRMFPLNKNAGIECIHCLQCYLSVRVLGPLVATPGNRVVTYNTLVT